MAVTTVPSSAPGDAPTAPGDRAGAPRWSAYQWAAGRLPKLARYGAVSAVSTVTSLTVLGVLVSTRWLTPGWANVVATAIGTVPSFELNRRWVWGHSDRRSWTRQVLPFVTLSALGLGLSTVAVSLTATWVGAMGITGVARTAAIELANLSAFGSLWLVQFILLDLVLFAHRDHGDAAPGVIPASTPGRW